MPAARLGDRASWPTGLYESKSGYFVYRSPISGRNLAIGRVPLKEAQAYAVWQNDQADAAKFEDKVGALGKPHEFADERGLLDASFIARKAMAFDRICGVYFLLKGDVIVYVGQSVSIMTRLGEHKRDVGKDFDRVFVIECPAGNMTRMERMYIDKFKPIHNTQMHPIDADAPLWSENIRSLLGEGIHSAI